MNYNCPTCGSEFETETNYCQTCGSNLMISNTENPVCPTCNTSYPIGTNFCTKDGTQIKPMYNHANRNFNKSSLINRFLASILDGLITLVLSVPSIIIYFNTAMGNWSGYGFLILIILFSFIPLTYIFIKDGLGIGQSWGKKALDLLVVDLDNNTPCDKWKSFIRNLISTMISIIPFIGCFVDPIILLASKDGRTLGDMVANTQVIDKIHA